MPVRPLPQRRTDATVAIACATTPRPARFAAGGLLERDALVTRLPPDARSGSTDQPPRRWSLGRRLGWRVGSRWLAPLALGLVGAVTGLLLFTTFHSAPPQITRAEIKEVIATSIARAATAPPRSTAVFRAILPSLVYIRTEGNEERERASGIGSGVIVRDDGTILTANHVVEGARRIIVTFADGTESEAQVVTTYPNDLAVLVASRGPELVVPAVLGGGAQVGDETYAVGNPLGLTASFSAGVISGLNRSLQPPRGGSALTGLIQFDAAVNPGSSGGPLLNREGQVIGIVTALANPSNESSFTGIGFAVPLGTAGGGPGGPPR
jgi:S1-C subfamily serine protease